LRGRVGVSGDVFRVSLGTATSGRRAVFNDRREPMSAKKRRQTMEKFRREQAVKQRRAEKLQRKADARLAKAAGATADETTPGDETPIVDGQGPEPAPASTAEQT
jgi:hypothetical protein